MDKERNALAERPADAELIPDMSSPYSTKKIKIEKIQQLLEQDAKYIKLVASDFLEDEKNVTSDILYSNYNSNTKKITGQVTDDEYVILLLQQIQFPIDRETIKPFYFDQREQMSGLPRYKYGNYFLSYVLNKYRPKQNGENCEHIFFNVVNELRDESIKTIGQLRIIPKNNFDDVEHVSNQDNPFRDILIDGYDLETKNTLSSVDFFFTERIDTSSGVKVGNSIPQAQRVDGSRIFNDYGTPLNLQSPEKQRSTGDDGTPVAGGGSGELRREPPRDDFVDKKPSETKEEIFAKIKSRSLDDTTKHYLAMLYASDKTTGKTKNFEDCQSFVEEIINRFRIEKKISKFMTDLKQTFNYSQYTTWDETKKNQYFDIMYDHTKNETLESIPSARNYFIGIFKKIFDYIYSDKTFLQFFIKPTSKSTRTELTGLKKSNLISSISKDEPFDKSFSEWFSILYCQDLHVNYKTPVELKDNFEKEMNFSLMALEGYPDKEISDGYAQLLADLYEKHIGNLHIQTVSVTPEYNRGFSFNSNAIDIDYYLIHGKNSINFIRTSNMRLNGDNSLILLGIFLSLVKSVTIEKYREVKYKDYDDTRSPYKNIYYVSESSKSWMTAVCLFLPNYTVDKAFILTSLFLLNKVNIEDELPVRYVLEEQIEKMKTFLNYLLFINTTLITVKTEDNQTLDYIKLQLAKIVSFLTEGGNIIFQNAEENTIVVFSFNSETIVVDCKKSSSSVETVLCKPSPERPDVDPNSIKVYPERSIVFYPLNIYNYKGCSSPSFSKSSQHCERLYTGRLLNSGIRDRFALCEARINSKKQLPVTKHCPVLVDEKELVLKSAAVEGKYPSLNKDARVFVRRSYGGKKVTRNKKRRNKKTKKLKRNKKTRKLRSKKKSPFLYR
jgi:hypothetical protein